MQGDRYRTVREVVEEARDWSTSALIADGDIGDQLQRLEFLFSVAASHHDDPVAQSFVSWIFHALDDAELTPHLKEERGKKYLPYSMPPVGEAKQRAMRARAEKVIALWPTVPTHAMTRADGEYRPSEEISTLLGTKKVMLTEVANRWRNTTDEAEADRLFVFLTGVGPHVGFGEERKMMQGVIREATGQFPVERLARHIIAVTSGQVRSVDSETARILAIAWARNSNPEVMHLQFSAVNPLMGCSIAAYELVREFALKVANLDRASRFLETVLGEKDVFAKAPPGEYERVPGRLTVAYPSAEVIRAHLEIGLHWRTEFDENKGHEWFEAAKRNIRRWQEEHAYPITLELAVVRGDRKERVFFREQSLSVEGAGVTP